MRCPAPSIKPQPLTSLMPLPIGPLSLSHRLLRLPLQPHVRVDERVDRLLPLALLCNAEKRERRGLGDATLVSAAILEICRSDANIMQIAQPAGSNQLAPTAFQKGKLKIAAHVREELERVGIKADSIRCKSGGTHTPS